MARAAAEVEDIERVKAERDIYRAALIEVNGGVTTAAGHYWFNGVAFRALAEGAAVAKIDALTPKEDDK
jgi:nitric oxide reductase large subunit